MQQIQNEPGLFARLTHPLKSFKIYEIIVAIICICIPFLLKLSDKETYYPQPVKVLQLETFKNENFATKDSLNLIPKDRLGFRESISDYVYSLNGYLFGMLLCIAAMLFIFNGIIYFKSEDTLRLNSKGKWYNIVLGIALLGVVCTPHRDYVILHYCFALLFFVGNAVVIGIFHNKEDKKKSIAMSILSILLLCLSLFMENVTLLWSEWLSLTVIGIHLILESKTKELDYTENTKDK